MLNVIKMDIYRMLKAKSTWIIILTAIFFVAVTVYAVSYVMENPYTAEDEMQTEESVDSMFGIVVDEGDSIGQDGEVSTGEMFYSNVKSGMFLIFVAIFAAIFVNNEHKTGYIKNIAGQISSRGLLALSKIISCFVFCIMIFVIPFIANVLLSQIFLGYVDLSGFSTMLPAYGLQLLLHLSFAAFIAFFTILFRSAFSMAVGIMLPLGITNMICMVIDMLLHKIGIEESFSLYNYTLTGNVAQLAIDNNTDIWLRALIIGVIALIGFSSLSMYIFKKQDIK